ncbi:MAG: DUF2786 domain-containing protein [Planctomycetes bacterium]|nr:DUF2786 domain-containing protein [Planctomycetota bacterium]
MGSDWLLQLAHAWNDFNLEYLDGAMRQPGFRSSGSKTELGSWKREARLIEISVHHVLAAPWSAVLATLRHEMAHQYVDEVMHSPGETPHGNAFAHACRLLRVDPSASGALGGGDDPAAERVQRLVEKLLALGGSPNENEATAAMRKAHELMLAHNVDVVRRDADRRFVMRALGAVRKRHAAWEYSLGSLLAEFFFVETIWADDFDVHTGAAGTSLRVYGTPSNVAMAEYVHGYLAQVVDQLWSAWRRTGKVRGERARLQYFHGVLLGFRQKLREQAEGRTPAARDESGTALVWRGDPRLTAFYRWHHPRIRTVGGRMVPLTEARVAGREAGRSVTIHRPLHGGGDGHGGLLRG